LLEPSPNSRVDPESVDDPVCAELIQRIRGVGLELAIWHAAVVSDVPTFRCSTWDERRKTPYATRERGHGTHPYKRIALCRALTESIQSRLTHIAGSRDDLYWSVYGDDLDVGAPAHQAFIHQVKVTPCDVDYREIPEAPAFSSMRSLLLWLVDRVEAYAHSCCLVVDLSGPELPIQVVHVVAPGLDAQVQRPLYTPSLRMMDYLARQGLL
jgi:ribosomal protein S12 methylthiotransferase accessory factor